MASESRGIDRIEVTFDDPNPGGQRRPVVGRHAGSPAPPRTLINDMVDLSGRVGGSLPGRKVSDPGARHGGQRQSHRSCRRAEIRCHSGSPSSPGDGTVHIGNVLAFLHLRSHPPDRCRLWLRPYVGHGRSSTTPATESLPTRRTALNASLDCISAVAVALIARHVHEDLTLLPCSIPNGQTLFIVR